MNDDAGKGANHSLPGLAIAPNGRLDVAWNDSRNSPRPGNSPGRDRGLLDIYYASSSDQGQTFTGNERINDRALDRALGVWSNNVNASVAVGVASTNETVYFGWQEARAGANEAQSEDVYFASLHMDGSSVPVRTESSPRWPQLAAGTALGLGLGMVLVWMVARRNRHSTATEAL